MRQPEAAGDRFAADLLSRACLPAGREGDCGLVHDPVEVDEIHENPPVREPAGTDLNHVERIDRSGDFDSDRRRRQAGELFRQHRPAVRRREAFRPEPAFERAAEFVLREAFAGDG